MDWLAISVSVAGSIIGATLVTFATLSSKRLRRWLNLTLHEAIDEDEKPSIHISSTELDDLLENIMPIISEEPERLLNDPSIRDQMIFHLPFLIQVTLALAELHERQLKQEDKG